MIVVVSVLKLTAGVVVPNVILAFLVVVISIGLCILVGSSDVEVGEAFFTPSSAVVSARIVVFPVKGVVLSNVIVVGS